MDEKQVKQWCPKAENITITGSTISMKVGEFSMARNVTLSHSPGDMERQVKDLYFELQNMNRQIEAQQREARGK